MVEFNTGLGFGLTRNVDKANRGIEKALTQLAAARRITSFKDDASGGTMATQLESAFRGINEQMLSEQGNISLQQTKESGLASIVDGLQRIRELQVSAGNPTNTVEATQAIQQEIDQVTQDIQGTVQNTTYGDQKLIDPGDKLTAALKEGFQATGGTAGTDAVIEEVTAQRSAAGAQINASTSKVSQLQVAFENITASYSQIVDLDMAQGITKLTNLEIQNRLAIGSLKNMMNINRQNAQGLLGTLGA